MAKQTANAHPQVTRSQSPDPRSGVAAEKIPDPALAVAGDGIDRPDPSRAKSIATTPSPKLIRMKQPKNSAHNSPTMPCFHLSGKGPTALDSATVDTQPPPRRFVQEMAPRASGIAATVV